MTRARILADYVSSGDELADKAPLAGPTFTGTATVAKIVETGGVLKENLITNSGFDVWSNSNGFEVTGDEMVTNGSFTSDTSSWSYVTCTGASISGGQSGNCHEITYVSGSAYARNTSVTGLVAGRLYEFSFYFRLPSSGASPSASVSLHDGAVYVPTWGNMNDASWTRREVQFIASTNTLRIDCFINGAGKVLFDEITCKEAGPSCTASDNKAMDGWFKDVATDVIRQTPHATYTKDGSYYSLKVIFASGNEVMWPNGSTTTGLQGSPNHYLRFQGRTMTFGVWCYSSAATLVRLQDSDGTSTATHTGGGGWEWLEVTRTCDSSITYFRVNWRGAGTETAYFSQPMLVFGSSIGAGNYTRPQGEVINFENTISPTGYDGNSYTSFGAKYEKTEVISNGKIGRGAKGLHLKAYMRDSASSSDSGCWWAIGQGGAIQLNIGTSGSELPDNNYGYEVGYVPLDSDGNLKLELDASGSSTADITLKISSVELH